MRKIPLSAMIPAFRINPSPVGPVLPMSDFDRRYSHTSIHNGKEK